MTVLKVKEMSCEHCVQRIGKTLEAVHIEYEIDLATKTVTVQGDENIVKQAIEELDDIGFTVE